MKSKILLVSMILVIGLLIFGCSEDTKNPFDGTSWMMDRDKSILKYAKDTWTWDAHEMQSTGGATLKYNFRGNYKFKGDVATMISTHYYQNATEGWVVYTGQWTATLSGNSISVSFDGTIQPRSALVNDQVEETGYLILK